MPALLQRLWWGVNGSVNQLTDLSVCPRCSTKKIHSGPFGRKQWTQATLQFPALPSSHRLTVAAAVTARWQGPTTVPENNERGPALLASSPVFRPITKPLSYLPVILNAESKQSVWFEKAAFVIWNLFQKIDLSIGLWQVAQDKQTHMGCINSCKKWMSFLSHRLTLGTPIAWEKVLTNLAVTIWKTKQLDNVKITWTLHFPCPPSQWSP